MSTAGLAQIWSLGIPSTGEAPPALNFDIWAVNHILLYRAGNNALAYHANTTPRSETRLRGEGLIAYYSFLRNLTNTLISNALERGVAVPAIPDTPADWNEEASIDFKALAAQLRPHLVDPAGVAMDCYVSTRYSDPRPHWASEVAAFSVALDLFIQMAPAMGEMGVSELGPFLAQVTSDEIKEIAAVIREELLRIRAQQGSGWDEEEAKRLAQESLENMKQIASVGT